MYSNTLEYRPFKSLDFKEAVDIRAVLFRHCSLRGIHSTMVLYSLRSKGQHVWSKHIPRGLIIMKLLIWNTMLELRHYPGCSKNFM